MADLFDGLAGSRSGRISELTGWVEAVHFCFSFVFRWRGRAGVDCDGVTVRILMKSPGHSETKSPGIPT
jgi:hypothetical protein